jgi:hypothetical protein
MFAHKLVPHLLSQCAIAHLAKPYLSTMASFSSLA